MEATLSKHMDRDHEMYQFDVLIDLSESKHAYFNVTAKITILRFALYLLYHVPIVVLTMIQLQQTRITKCWLQLKSTYYGLLKGKI